MGQTIRTMVILGVASWGLTIVGCGPAVIFGARGNTCAPRPSGCEVKVITQRPECDYEVIGVLDLEAFSVRRIPGNEKAFRALVSSKVCRAGGDAVIPGINRDGRYIQATVVKWREPGQEGPVCPAKKPKKPGKKGAKKPPSAERSTSPEGVTLAFEVEGATPC